MASSTGSRSILRIALSDLRTTGACSIWSISLSRACIYFLSVLTQFSCACRFLSWSPITDPLCSWIIWHEYLTKPASYASHRSHQPVADWRICDNIISFGWSCCEPAPSKFSLSKILTRINTKKQYKLGLIYFNQSIKLKFSFYRAIWVCFTWIAHCTPHPPTHYHLFSPLTP